MLDLRLTAAQRATGVPEEEKQKNSRRKRLLQGSKKGKCIRLGHNTNICVHCVICVAVAQPK